MTPKKIFLIVVAIIVIAVIVTDSGLSVKSIEDGNTLILSNGAKVELIGVTNTKLGRDYLNQHVKGKEIELKADKERIFDPKHLSKNDVIYAYVHLKKNGQCINSLMLQDGYAQYMTSVCKDSSEVYPSYAIKGQQRNDNHIVPVTPGPKEEIDYAEDDIVLPAYVLPAERRITNWTNDPSNNIMLLQEACDYDLPYTKQFANKLAGRKPGNFSIEQVCEIVDYCYKKWSYVNDPNGHEYLSRASESINGSLYGDCDDYAVLMASLILAVGGDASVTLGFGQAGGHAWAEVDTRTFENSDESYIKSVVQKRFPNYPIEINIRQDDSHKWLNLDWQAAYPGGPYFPASKLMCYSCVKGIWNSR